jgi:hypothetical protein
MKIEIIENAFMPFPKFQIYEIDENKSPSMIVLIKMVQKFKIFTCV